MTTVHQVYTIRSFRSSKDRDFSRALRIYDAHTHPQVKTDSREIAHWLDHNETRKEGRFYVGGLYIGTDLVGYMEFIYLPRERLIHFDYFIIDPARRTAGAFYAFSDQMRAFFDEEKLEWDFVTAEIAEINPVNGVSRQAQALLRLFRQLGFYEILSEYQQPLLGVEHPDTIVAAKLVILPRVEIQSLSKARFLEIVAAIYRKHYGEWYSMHDDTKSAYQRSISEMLQRMEQRLLNQKEIELKGPERDFVESDSETSSPLRGALIYSPGFRRECADALGAHAAPSPAWSRVESRSRTDP